MSRTRDLADLINGISAAKITSGSLDAARLSNIDSDYVQLRQATADLTNLNASNLTSGTMPDARVSSGSVTQHVSAVTTAEGTWNLSVSAGNVSTHSSRYVRVGNLVSCTWWGDGTALPTYNTTLFNFGGLPITPKNTGDASDIVGFGYYLGKTEGAPRLWVLSGSSTIYFGRGSYVYEPDNTNTGGLYNQITSSSTFRYNNSNMNSQLNGDTHAYFALQIHYYV